MAESIDIKLRNLNSNGDSIWTGYKNFKDITNMEVSDLAPGSQNVFVQDGDRLEVRAGIDYFGAAGSVGNMTDPYWTINNRIHSKYDKFVNVQGVKIPIRVWYSGTTAQGDVMEVWLPIYVAGVATANKQWYQITATTTPTNVALSTHRYFFDEWWDPLNLLSHVVFTMGNNSIWNWTGGFANVVSTTPTTITTDTTWREKGFIDAPEGNDIVIINGVEYQLTAGDFSTNTITVASTAGINVDDVAFQSIDSNSTITGTTYDVCSTVNNQVYYIDWKQRNVYVSWDKNQIAYLGTQRNVSISGLNDGVFSGTYTGAPLSEGNGTYQVTIDSIDPATEEQNFIGSGGTGLNDVYFDTSGYSAGSGENTYRVLIVADFSFTFVGVPAIIPNPGDILTGGTSNAVGRVAFLDSGGQDPALEMLTPQGFIPGEIISGTQGTPYGTVFSVVPVNWFQLFKNGVSITPTAYAAFYAYQLSVGINPVLFTDGLSFSFQSTTGHTVGDYWELIINSGGPDTFSWTFNGVNQADNVTITGAPQLLSFGISIDFGATTGHALGDSWTITAYPEITRGWTQFFFTADGRLVGQGARLLLDSNGWTMSPQEKTMYINADAGHYYTVDRVLSADQLTETLKVERLKSELQNKALYPYLIGYDKNQLAAISQDKTYDSLGRQELLELPQTETISDDVRVDFETADWEDGDFIYFKRKLFFVVPRSGLMFVWDDYKQYWHSPMKFARRIGLVSIIDDTLVGHSYERNESYELFTGTSDLEIYPIETKMVFAYDSFGKRFFQKSSSAIGFEGYVEGAPDIFYRVNADVGGCNGDASAKILPVICLPDDTASLGKAYLGYHGLGNDPVDIIPHFFYIDTFEKLNYYQRNIELTCNSLDQRWSIVAIGTDVDLNQQNNTSIVHRKTV